MSGSWRYRGAILKRAGLQAGESKDHSLLRAALKNRSRGELKTLFAAIRASDDRALLAALAPPKKKAKRTDEEADE